MTQRTAMAILRLMFGLLVLIAVGWQLRIHMSLDFNVLNFFSYFTNLSNLFAAFVLLFSAGKHFADNEPTPTSNQLRLISATNMVVVGIVFAILLRNVELGSLRPWINTLLHYVMPIVVVL
ncbi:MAG: Pr6Pr family membrane protein, partial [Gemmatimonadaceae bacterium]